MNVPETNLPEYEYIQVQVIRSESTDLYLKVPKGWRPSGRNRKLLGVAAKETTSDFDWDNFGWENDIDVQGYKPVDAKEAELYKVFDVMPYLQPEKKHDST
jgi:hypothetical protein